MLNSRKIIFFGTLIFLAFSFCLISNRADLDLWHRLVVGCHFFNNGEILYQDIYSYLPVKNIWVDHEWGSGIILYAFYHFLGEKSLFLLKFLILFSTLLLIWALNKNRYPQLNHYRIIFYLIVMYGIFFGLKSTIRCHAFTYLFFTLWIYVLEKIRNGEYYRWFWFFPLTMLFWCNLHGGFVSGIGLIVIYIVGEFLNKKCIYPYLKILFFILLVTLINPYGFSLWHFIIDAVSIPRKYIVEWAPIYFFGPFYYLSYKIILMLTIAGLINSIFIRKNRNLDKTGMLIIIVTLYLSLKHIRHTTFFVIAASVFGYGYFFELIDSFKSKIAIFFKKKISSKVYGFLILFYHSAIYALLILFCISCLMTRSFSIDLQIENGRFPVKATNFILQKKLSGNLLLPFDWGSYALWHLYPYCRVSIDGRYEEVYPESTFEEVYFFFNHIYNWKQILKKYHHDIILIDKKEYFRTYLYLYDSYEWEKIYEDEYAAVFLPV